MPNKSWLWLLLPVAVWGQSLPISRSEVDDVKLVKPSRSAYFLSGKRDFARVDRWALAARPSDETDLQHLGNYLGCAGTDALSRHRAIYVWVADRISYDLNANWLSADEVLRGRKATCDGYSNLYLALTAQLGLEAEKVKGFAFGNPKLAEWHAWVRVQFDRQWAFVDPTWGREGNLEDWFLTPPQTMIRSHYPEQYKWQLLTPQLSKKAFERFHTLAGGRSLHIDFKIHRP